MRSEPTKKTRPRHSQKWRQGKGRNEKTFRRVQKEKARLEREETPGLGRNWRVYLKVLVNGTARKGLRKSARFSGGGAGGAKGKENGQQEGPTQKPKNQDHSIISETAGKVELQLEGSSMP